VFRADVVVPKPEGLLKAMLRGSLGGFSEGHEARRGLGAATDGLFDPRKDCVVAEAGQVLAATPWPSRSRPSRRCSVSMEWWLSLRASSWANDHPACRVVEALEHSPPHYQTPIVAKEDSTGLSVNPSLLAVRTAWLRSCWAGSAVEHLSASRCGFQ
jgi:hypothetical protein